MRVSALIEAATRGCEWRALPRGGVCSGPAIHHGPCQGWASRFTPRVIGQDPGARPGAKCGWVGLRATGTYRAPSVNCLKYMCL